MTSRSPPVVPVAHTWGIPVLQYSILMDDCAATTTTDLPHHTWGGQGEPLQTLLYSQSLSLQRGNRKLDPEAKISNSGSHGQTPVVERLPVEQQYMSGVIQLTWSMWSHETPKKSAIQADTADTAFTNRMLLQAKILRKNITWRQVHRSLNRKGHVKAIFWPNFSLQSLSDQQMGLCTREQQPECC